MRIAAIEVELIDVPAVSPPFAWRRGLRGSQKARTTALLRITTDEGAAGEAYHEWSGPMLADIVDRVLREELVGERADRREWLWRRLWGVPHLGVRRGRRSAVGSRGPGPRGARPPPARHVPGDDPGLRLDDDLLDRRGVPRRRRPVSGARLSRPQAPRVG